MKVDMGTTERGHYGSAHFSDDGAYRYRLKRRWGPGANFVLWLMLNPSTASATTDDATIRRCIRFSTDWGYDGLLVGNLYAYRARDPKQLARCIADGFDPVGPDNLEHVHAMVREASRVVCAWGQPGPVDSPRFNVLQELRDAAPHILKLNQGFPGKMKDPAHPLRLAACLRPQRWDIFDDPGNGHGS